MSCVECRFEYVMKKLAVHDTSLRRVRNVMHCSENSSQVSTAMQKIAQDMEAFEAEWNGKKECTHGNGDKADNKDGYNGTGFDATKDGANTVTTPLVETANSIGLNSVPSKAFAETSKPKSGSKGGRPPAGWTGSGAGKGGGTSGGGGRKR